MDTCGTLQMQILRPPPADRDRARKMYVGRGIVRYNIEIVFPGDMAGRTGVGLRVRAAFYSVYGGEGSYRLLAADDGWECRWMPTAAVWVGGQTQQQGREG